MSEPSPEKEESHAAVDYVAEVIAQHLGLSSITAKVTEIATAVIDRIRIMRDPGPHDVVTVYVDSRQPKPDAWWTSMKEFIKTYFVGARIMFVPVELDLRRVPADGLPAFRDKIADLLTTIELTIAAAAMELPAEVKPE